MTDWWGRMLAVFLLATGGIVTASTAQAQSTTPPERESVLTKKDNQLYLYLGSYVHFSSSDDHDGTPIIGGAEWRRPKDWFFGLSLFNNSFNQFSQYLYLGKRWPLAFVDPKLHLKVSAGLIHGYHGRFEDKIPLNNYGIAPAIIPSLSYDLGDFEASMSLMGTAGLTFTLGYNVVNW